MPLRWNENRLSAKLGIDYPVIQGPLGGLSSHTLTAAVSNFGGLGSFGAHSLTPEANKEAITEIRSLTSKPFAMNLWVSMEGRAGNSEHRLGPGESCPTIVRCNWKSSVSYGRFHQCSDGFRSCPRRHR